MELDFGEGAGKFDGCQNALVKVRADVPFEVGFGVPAFEVQDGFVVAVFFVDAAFFASWLGLRGPLDGPENGQQVAALIPRGKKPYSRNHHGESICENRAS